MVSPVVRRTTQPKVVQQLWTSINFVRSQKQIANTERVMRYMHRTFGFTQSDARMQLQTAVTDGLVERYTLVGSKGAKTGVEQEGFKIPEPLDDVRMGNLHGWGGPLPQSWIHNQVALQHQILKRMRNFGMTPVLPAFAGHVPQNITRLFPNASVTHAGDWGGFNKTYCCTTLLDFSDPLFVKIGKSFIEEYTNEFGTDHVYNCDSFNENTPPKGDPAFIASAGRQVYQAMAAADPDAIWLMQGWLFSHGKAYWTSTRSEALVTSVPQKNPVGGLSGAGHSHSHLEGRMIVLDMPSDIFPQYARLDSYFGQPFIWTMLHNFGGNLAMYGILPNISTGPFLARNFPKSSMVGVGLTMEGIFQNYVMYEFMMEHAWRKAPWNISKWISNYHTNRYGHFDSDVDIAWQILKSSVYNCTDPSERHGHGKNLIVRRPRRNQRIDRTMYNCTFHFESHVTDIIVTRRPYTNMVGQEVWYNPNDLYSAWDHMIKAAPSMAHSDLFRHDLVDVSRQCLQVLAIKYYADLNKAFKARNVTETMSAGAAFVDLLLDMDTLLATDSHFLLGLWLESAKKKGTTDAERVLYEYNARNQITLWGPTGNIIDYANKQWAGLMSDYYAGRWKLYVTILVNILKTGQSYNRTMVDHEIFTKVETPFTHSRKLYPTTATGYAVDVVKHMHAKYRPVMFEHAAFFHKLPKSSGSDGKFAKQAGRWMKKHARKNRKENGSYKEFNSSTNKGHQWSHQTIK